MEDVLNKVFQKIESLKDEMVEMQKKMIALPAISPVSGGKGELRKARYLEPILREIFDEVTFYNAPHPEAEEGIRPNIVAKMRGKNSSKTIWFMAHLDVVPEGDRKLWNTDPFTGVVKDGKIYGRGAEDNQQAIASSIAAAKALKELGIRPSYDVGLLLVADEETGNNYGINYLLSKYNGVSNGDLVIVPDSGDPNGEKIEVAEKSILWLKVTTKGVQSHGAFPNQGKNAHKAAAYLITAIDGLYNKFTERDEIFDYPRHSFEPTKKEANVPNVNTIPGEDVTYFDCRLLPSLKREDFLEEFKRCASEIEKRFGVQITIETVQSVASSKTEPDAPVVKAVQRAVKRVLGRDAHPYGTGGGTVAAVFRNKGIPAAVYSKMDEVPHTPNEYCVIDNMVSDAKVWAHIMLEG